MFLLILLIVATLFLLTILYAGSSLAPWYPTSSKDYTTIATTAALQPGEQLLEIGCGDGRVCLALARAFPDSAIFGIELSYGLYLLCKFKAWIFGIKNTRFMFGNALQHSIKPYDVIYIYGLPKTVNGTIKQKLIDEMKPSTRLVSYTFEIKDWPGAMQKYEKEDGGWIYVYNN
jgi:precorrin-6B methylase 2